MKQQKSNDVQLDIKKMGEIINDQTLAYNPKLKKICEDNIIAGLVLNQLHYWWRNCSNKEIGFYKTVKELQNELVLTRYSIDKAIKLLINLGFIEKKHKRLEHKTYYIIKTKNIYDAAIKAGLINIDISEPKNQTSRITTYRTCLISTCKNPLFFLYRHSYNRIRLHKKNNIIFAQPDNVDNTNLSESYKNYARNHGINDVELIKLTNEFKNYLIYQNVNSNMDDANCFYWKSWVLAYKNRNNKYIEIDKKSRIYDIDINKNQIYISTLKKINTWTEKKWIEVSNDLEAMQRFNLIKEIFNIRVNYGR